MIVVGVDGSEPSLAALRFAYDEALVRETGVLAVLAWQVPLPVGVPGAMVPVVSDDVGQEAEKALDEALAAVPPPAGVQVERRLVERPAARALIDACSSSDLLVVGSRGHGGFAGLLLGSVSAQCIHHAPCPVIVVHGSTDHRRVA